MTIKATMKLTSRGRVTLPRPVRERLGLHPGDAVEFVEEDGTFRIRKQPAENPFDMWRGYLKEFAGMSTDDLIEDWRGR
jgi:AbrB family looped-hinge helix DNA binding protein